MAHVHVQLSLRDCNMFTSVLTLRKLQGCSVAKVT